eukprot:c15604_g1_i1.p1 GENE.c15604_g1_i1~~c15604_g1_i1.p1  ORF type:complete len:1139 (-),score=210.16 c15604_g1_i1:23-2932(-)
MNENKLSGYLPTQLGVLNLKFMDMDYNSFTGPLPSQLGVNLKLQRIDLDNNQLSGGVPSQLGRLTNLKYIDLHRNALSGRLISEIGCLTQVTILNFQKNRLVGSVPLQIGQLKNLTKLNLAENFLRGDIPDEIEHLTNLIELNLKQNALNSLPHGLEFPRLERIDVSKNFLVGEIPKSLSLSTHLQFIDFSENHLSGSLPTQLGLLTELTTLFLNNNSFVGPIPKQICTDIALSEINLSDNELTGTIPAQLTRLKNLTILFLSQNHFSGSIPREVASIKNMLIFEISRNQISGTVPHQFGLATQLRSLLLDHNFISGTIPEQLRTLSFLANLNLANNLISGMLPTVIGDLTSLLSLRVDFNQLVGHIPSEMWRLTDLNDLGLSNNRFTGSLPPQIGQLSSLTRLALRRNNLLGELPITLRRLSNLEFVDLSSNQLTDGIDPLMNPSIKFLVLHRNAFYGKMPIQILAMSNLQIFTLFDNHMNGSLPEMVMPEKMLLNDNHFSCELPHRLSKHAGFVTLLSLGNFFRWDGGRDYLSNWDRHSVHLFETHADSWELAVGATVTALVLTIALLVSRRKFVASLPWQTPLSSQLIGLCLPATCYAGVFLAVLGTSEPIHLCANSLTYLTLAETYDSCPRVATNVVLVVLVNLVGIWWLRRWDKSNRKPRPRFYRNDAFLQGLVERLSLPWAIKAVVLWCVGVLVCNVPMLVAIMFGSIPTERHMFFDEFLQAVWLAFICNLSPAASNWAINKFYGIKGAVHFASRKRELAVGSQLVLVVILPSIARVLFDSNCLRLTRGLWGPCAQGEFDWAINDNGENTVVLTQDEVCHTGQIYDADICVRKVVAKTSNLVFGVILVQSCALVGIVGLLELCVMISDICSWGNWPKILRSSAHWKDMCAHWSVLLIILGVVAGGAAPLIWIAVSIGMFVNVFLGCYLGKPSADWGMPWMCVFLAFGLQISLFVCYFVATRCE